MRDNLYPGYICPCEGGRAAMVWLTADEWLGVLKRMDGQPWVLASSFSAFSGDVRFSSVASVLFRHHVILRMPDGYSPRLMIRPVPPDDPRAGWFPPEADQ